MGIGAKLGLSISLIGVLLSLTGTPLFAAWVVADTNTSSFSTNTITLSDNQGGLAGYGTTATGTALFSVAGIEPGSANSVACIGVNFSGTASVSTLKLKATLSGAGATTLKGVLTMVTAEYNKTGTVSGTSNAGSCTNYPSSGTNTTVGTQGATLSTWAASTYNIATPATNTWYKFDVSGLPSTSTYTTGCATYCGRTITIALTWTLTTT